MKQTTFDLLSTVQEGGCSVKLPAGALSTLLSSFAIRKDKNVLVDIDTHDDAGVYKLNEETALIVTTDFFPPVCSNPYQFGQIAAANSLSDVYAMGGTPLLVLNITLYPSTMAPLEALRDILAGGQSKIDESGALTMGGHTINDSTPKYGLAVVGTVHPDQLITNSGLKPGQKIILTKPLGCGIQIAAHRLGIPSEGYEMALQQMATLNDLSARIMKQFGATGATDITGFGLAGHALKMAQASHVSIQIHSNQLPTLPNSLRLLEEGCVPSTVFRNLEFVAPQTIFAPSCDNEHKFLCCDAQTSGGLFFGVDASKANDALEQLHRAGISNAQIIGETLEYAERPLLID